VPAAQKVSYHGARWVCCNPAAQWGEQGCNGVEMTGSKHNHEGNSRDSGEPEPGPYWKRMHRDWRFWIGALFMAAALAVYVLSGDLAWVPHGHRLP